MDFKLILVDPKEHLIAAWKEKFDAYPNVSYHHGRFEEIEKFDYLINAGNSYGLMDGGVDYAISEYFGWHVQKNVQEIIKYVYAGEQPVGTAFITSLHEECMEYEGCPPFIVHTPTMRDPSIIKDTDNVYNAFRAALLAITRYDKNKYPSGQRIAVCMGLGTSCGGMAVEECARQMHLAYKYLLDVPNKITWDIVKRRRQELQQGPTKGYCIDYLTKDYK